MRLQGYIGFESSGCKIKGLGFLETVLLDLRDRTWGFQKGIWCTC